MEVKKRIVCFDFDGTLTTRDTLLLFIRFACGRWAFLWGMLCYAPLLVLMKLRLYHNGKTKQKIFSHFFRGWTIDDFNDICLHFSDSYRHLLRSQTVEALHQAQQNGTSVFIVSASIVNWVQPFFPDVRVVGTQIEVQNGVLTGRFLTPNCYGPEKVRRVMDIIGERSSFYITAYGDSRGDREMLQWADEGIKVKG